MQPQGDSIWGNINLCIEIALNIYYLCGEKGEGIVIPKEQAEKDFSPETVAAGKESDGYLYYPKGEAMEMFRQCSASTITSSGDARTGNCMRRTGRTRRR